MCRGGRPSGVGVGARRGRRRCGRGTVSVPQRRPRMSRRVSGDLFRASSRPSDLVRRGCPPSLPVRADSVICPCHRQPPFQLGPQNRHWGAIDSLELRGLPPGVMPPRLVPADSAFVMDLAAMLEHLIKVDRYDLHASSTAPTAHPGQQRLATGPVSDGER